MNVRVAYRETKTDDVYILVYEHGSDGIWRIRAEQHPDNPFDNAVYSCHLYSNGEICVDHSKFAPRALDQAKACAYLWMEGYSQYVRTGVFPATGARVRV